MFRDPLDYVTQQQYRIIYEDDFVNNMSLSTVIGLPAFFRSLVELEAAYEAIELVQDESPEWDKFYEKIVKRLGPPDR